MKTLESKTLRNRHVSLVDEAFSMVIPVKIHSFTHFDVIVIILFFLLVSFKFLMFLMRFDPELLVKGVIWSVHFEFVFRFEF